MDYNNDLLDQLVGLKKQDLIGQIRKNRPLTLQANQHFFELIFTIDIPSLSLSDRIYAAFYSSLLTKQSRLQNYFTHISDSLSKTVLSQIKNEQIPEITDSKLKTILLFTQRVTINPDTSNQEYLLELQNSGLTTQAIVVLAQLIGFIAYQSRLIFGLTAMNDYVKMENINAQ